MMTKSKKYLQLKKIAHETRKQILSMIVDAHASHIASSYSIVEILEFLYEKILRINPKEYLEQYCKDGSKMIGIATRNGIPGIEATTGSMGHGLPIGVGIAKALKLQKRKSRVFVMISDGECDEGSTWEGVLIAAHHKLDNLTVIIDYNKWQSFG